MSVSKKPVNLPIRRRLKPTVNLNVAIRRKKDVPITSSQEADVSVEETETPITISNESEGLIKQTVLSCSTDQDHERNKLNSPELKNEYNTTQEYEESLFSQATVVLDHNADSDDAIKIGFENSILSRENSAASVISTASTVKLVSISNGTHEDVQNICAGTSIPRRASVESVSSSTPTIILTNVHNEDHVPNIYLQSSGQASTKSVEEKVCTSELSPQVIKDNIHFTSSSNSVKPKKNDSLQSEACERAESNAESRAESRADSRVENKAGSLITDCAASVCSTSSIESRFDGSLPKRRKYKKEITRKISKARQEFETKFQNTIPERSALRMVDLIYYNPATNPMKASTERNNEIVLSEKETESSHVSEENIDNPSENDNVDDEDSGIPAPRLKVGPNGEIVIDEQSLVIETTQSKKSKQDMANLTVVVDTGSNTTYNTYSKKKRSRKDWNVSDTVRFYKALQTLGTDFSLMQTLFPDRSRMDLKAKFKKEEKINNNLIEKALRFPTLFDLSEFEKNAREEIAMKEKPPKKPRKKKRDLQSLGFDEQDDGPSLIKKRRKGKKRMPPRKCDNGTGKENLEMFSDCTSDEDSCVNSGNPHEKNSNHKVIGCDRSHLRRGKIQDKSVCEWGNDFLEAGIDLLESCDTEERNSVGSSAQNDVCEENVPGTQSEICNIDMKDVQPGSLVILTTQCPDNPGYQICNVFMVQEGSGGRNNESQPSECSVVAPREPLENDERTLPS